jgi:hypothetical protein
LVGFDAHALSFIRKVLPTSIGDKIISIYLWIKGNKVWVK